MKQTTNNTTIMDNWNYSKQAMNIELDRIYNMDCLEGMKAIPDGSVDMVLCDLPYGTTANKWDSIIPRIDISVSKWSFYMAITWFRMRMYVYLTTDGAKYLDNHSFSTPLLVFRRLPKIYKEKWDFQFFFLWMEYRHFFGKRKEYECSLKDCEICKFTWKK